MTTTVQAEPEIPTVTTLLANKHLKTILENLDLNKTSAENSTSSALRGNSYNYFYN